MRSNSFKDKINTKYSRRIIYIYIYVCVCVCVYLCVCVCVCVCEHEFRINSEERKKFVSGLAP